jgi:hypothetical protein
MLNVILYTSQSFIAILPQLYDITYRDKEMLFIHTGLVVLLLIICSKGKGKQKIRGTE